MFVFCIKRLILQISVRIFRKCECPSHGLWLQEMEAKSRSNSIDKSLSHGHEESSKRIKLLLLGASESGKSTIMKQMKIIHNNGFTDEDHRRYKPVIRSNKIMSLIFIIKGMNKMKIDFGDEKRLKDAELPYQVASKGEDTLPFSPELVEAMKRLWQDTGARDYSRLLVIRTGTCSNFSFIRTVFHSPWIFLNRFN